MKARGASSGRSLLRRPPRSLRLRPRRRKKIRTWRRARGLLGAAGFGRAVGSHVARAGGLLGAAGFGLAIPWLIEGATRIRSMADKHVCLALALRHAGRAGQGGR